MKILRHESYKRMPWRNGQGVTSEIMVWPPGCDAGEFEWRVSMALVTSDGAFSQFDGIDRTLTVIEGEAIELTLGNDPPVLLEENPFFFPGDVSCHARLTMGPITDLNVLVRRDRWSATVERRSAVEPTTNTNVRLIVSLTPECTATVANQTIDLRPRDTIYLDNPSGAAVAVGGEVLDIQLRRL